MIKLKRRVYEHPYQNDGASEILVDRLWPRGLSKDKARIDLWLKEMSRDGLRKRFHHETGQWKEFKIDTFASLRKRKDLVRLIASKSKAKPVTLLFGAKNKV